MARMGTIGIVFQAKKHGKSLREVLDAIKGTIWLKNGTENQNARGPQETDHIIVLAESVEQTDQHQSQEEEERTARHPEGGSSRLHG